MILSAMDNPAKHLFLEGKSGSGKTGTLLRVLKPYLKRAAGFVSCRLLTPDGNVAAHCLTPASNPAAELPYSADAENVFIARSEASARANIDAFENAVGLLDSKRPRMVILDEIGGVELLSDRFANRLFELLDGDIPCAGVLKSAESCRRMAENLDLPSDIMERHAKLRSRIESCGDCRLVDIDARDVTADSAAEVFADSVSLDAIVLASGFSRRFGSDKLMSPVGGIPLYQRTVNVLREAVGIDRIIVVARSREILDWSRASGCTAAFNPDAAEGISASVRHGVAASNAGHYLITVCDLPKLDAGTVSMLCDEIDYCHIITPTVHARPASPNIFPKSFRSALLSLRGDTGGGGLRSDKNTVFIEIPRGEVLTDLDA